MLREYCWESRLRKKPTRLRVGVHHCCVLESGIDDLEDEFDRMAELMEMGRI